MSLDKRILMLEGLALHVGPASAVQCVSTFNTLYLAKHGTCFSYVEARPTERYAFSHYVRHESRAFEKYVLLWAYAKTRRID